MWNRGLVCVLVVSQGEAWNTLLNTQLHGGQHGLTRELPFGKQMRGETGNLSLQKHTRGSFLIHQRRGCQCRARWHGKSHTRKVLLGVGIAQDVSYGRKEHCSSAQKDAEIDRRGPEKLGVI